MARCIPEIRFLLVLVCSLILMGCEGREEKKARAEAAEAKILLSKVRGDLARAKKDLADLNDELRAVKEVRDELDKQVGQLAVDRDKAMIAVEVADQRIKNLTAQVNEQTKSLSLLKNEIKELNATIEEQRTTIAEQQETIADLEKIINQQPIIEEQNENVEQQEETTKPGEVIEEL